MSTPLPSRCTIDSTQGNWNAAITGSERFERVDYQLPKDIGVAWLESMGLSSEMRFSRAVHQFHPNCDHRMYVLPNILSNYDTDIFMIQVIIGGNVFQKESTPEISFLFRPGLAVFRHTHQIKMTPSVDMSSGSEVYSFSCSIKSLVELIGEEEKCTLLSNLELSTSPSLTVRPISPSIIKIMKKAASYEHFGVTQALYIQSQMIEMIGALIECFNNPQIAKPNPNSISRRALIDLRQYLANIEGAVPTLSDLSKTFDLPARQVNAAFKTEFGRSIYSYIKESRLQASYDRVLHGVESLKEISFMAGYSHVNHFINAFRKRFGVSPGKLRNGHSQVIPRE